MSKSKKEKKAYVYQTTTLGAFTYLNRYCGYTLIDLHEMEEAEIIEAYINEKYGKEEKGE
ncbi:hypothetical protein [Clostridium felsineum]|uniref:hypothetical protein n=1 Tax=Clostridium felsineum TaxID=36839 RepID=UPI00098CB9C8|nr:hypothetical protein [Clostridium felsineum]URZ16891.1 hypothetical protein CLFE_029380 [Clostridium felsineum DSM 794]